MLSIMWWYRQAIFCISIFFSIKVKRDASLSRRTVFHGFPRLSWDRSSWGTSHWMVKRLKFMKGAHFVNGMHRVELCIQTTLCCICLATVSGSPNPFYSMSVASSIFAGQNAMLMKWVVSFFRIRHLSHTEPSSSTRPCAPRRASHDCPRAAWGRTAWRANEHRTVCWSV